MWQAGVIYASVDTDDLLTLDDSDAFGLSGNVKVGANGKVKAQYLSADSPIVKAGDLGFSPSVKIAGGDNDVDQWSIGYEHALSKRTTLHAGYTSYEADKTNYEETAFFGGIIHNF
jgi:predicted porin